MERTEGQRVLVRIFIGERDRAQAGPHRGKPLYDALVQTFRDHGMAGATVLRGIEGYGASARMHTARLVDLSLDLPLVVEMVDTEEKVRAILPVLDPLIGSGLVTMEKVDVILYRSGATDG